MIYLFASVSGTDGFLVGLFLFKSKSWWCLRCGGTTAQLQCPQSTTGRQP